MTKIPMNPLRPIEPTGPLKKSENQQQTDAISSFKDILEKSLQKVDDMNIEQNEAVQKVVTGKSVSIEDITSATRTADDMLKEMDSIRTQMESALKGLEKWAK